ncbi:translation initiation factor 2 beta subunit (eIF-2beta)/eIF-5 [Crossiella equi]|uniref:Translation initiation factor 2 beta subunit (eIF-2beta)/eIF-5 n=1 Tax=Crossiella equi TaxID=130796 RepID=A0ABS5A3L4_9PSEU|nr:hypothetical protein [Crossiella equi]MBP2471170.1 translation initiation factor 2 beta subunit (eIF-2beta)/eIF-5 [Crossiella equi]
MVRTALRILLFITAVAAAAGAVVTRELDGRALLLTSPQSDAADYVKRLDVLTEEVLGNDTTMRAVLSQNTRGLTAEPVRRSLATIRQVLGAAGQELGRQREEKKVPDGFGTSHGKLVTVVSALDQHYEALQRAIAATSAQDQQQALLAARSTDNRYAELLMDYLREYQQRLAAAGFRLTEAPR